jgi:hypothetical protein
MHKFPQLRIPKLIGFCLECHFIIKICWFEVGQSEFKHPVDIAKIIKMGSLHASQK